MLVVAFVAIIFCADGPVGEVRVGRVLALPMLLATAIRNRAWNLLCPLLLEAVAGWALAMEMDPVEANPQKYRVVFENDRVRVLEYTDTPGHSTIEHHHPDSVMITASAFRRRLSSNGHSVDVELPSGVARWLSSQDHYGENIGETDTRAFFVELKEPAPGPSEVNGGSLGPEGP